MQCILSNAVKKIVQRLIVRTIAQCFKMVGLMPSMPVTLCVSRDENVLKTSSSVMSIESM